MCQGWEGRQGWNSGWVCRRLQTGGALLERKTCPCRSDLPSLIAKGRKQVTAKGLGLGAGADAAKHLIKRDCDF